MTGFTADAAGGAARAEMGARFLLADSPAVLTCARAHCIGHWLWHCVS